MWTVLPHAVYSLEPIYSRPLVVLVVYVTFSMHHRDSAVFAIESLWVYLYSGHSVAWLQHGEVVVMAHTVEDFVPSYVQSHRQNGPQVCRANSLHTPLCAHDFLYFTCNRVSSDHLVPRGYFRRTLIE